MTRLDSELVRRSLAQSRERAKEYILGGLVEVNGRAAQKPSEAVSEEDKIAVVGETLKYVGRGGLKLERAISAFGLDLRGLVCLDIGASTGGFTDCMLQSGAKKVYAVDVGHDQLAEKLRADGRVVSLEGVNVKDISPEMFGEPIDFVCADLSFISSRFAAEAAKRVLDIGKSAVLLIKPQFEAGKKNLSKGGIVKSPKVRIEVLKSLCGYYSSIGFEVKDIIPSPIKGGDGNIEFLACLVKQNGFTAQPKDFDVICERAESLLKGAAEI